MDLQAYRCQPGSHVCHIFMFDVLQCVPVAISFRVRVYSLFGRYYSCWKSWKTVQRAANLQAVQLPILFRGKLFIVCSPDNS